MAVVASSTGLRLVEARLLVLVKSFLFLQAALRF